MMERIRQNQEYRNYVSIYTGLALVGEKLEGYTEQKLQDTYNVIYRKLAGKPHCRQQCSKLYRNNTAKWCDTCESWRSELQKTRSTNHKVSWGSMDSSKWPTSHKNIAEVYLPGPRNITDFKDVSSASHIWANLKTCKVNRVTIDRIKTVRNAYYAHNSNHICTEREKLNAFNVFEDLLNDADVQGHINYNECYDELLRLKGGHDRQLANIENILVELRNPQTLWYLYIYKLLMFFLTLTVSAVCFGRRTFKKYYMLVCMVFFVAAAFFHSGDIHQQDCLSEDYSYPFKQDMPLLGYLSEHKTLIGREWLFEDIRKSIFKNTNDVRKDIIALVAEMGYGKSALVAHMLCPDRDSQASIIRKHIIGFHVCKFDVMSTRAPERFIRRLVGFLAHRSAEYGRIISSLGPNSVLYHMDECAKDYLACFDQGITNPLKQLKESENLPWIILIDALDECESSGKNIILQLLLSRINNFPRFLKFLLTSRNSSSLTNHKRLEVNYLFANDTRHIDDIVNYISQHISNETHVRKLAHYSDGNFVYVVQAIKWLLVNGNGVQIPKLPVDLEDVYEINFDRVYKDNKSYNVPRMILEIVCSAVNPIEKSYIFNILNESNIFWNSTEFDKHFDSLSFFLNVDETVRLTHQALFHWLVSESNVKYRISVEKGHSYISQYLLSSTSTLGPTDLVDLTIHVCNSDNPTLAKLYQSSNFRNIILEERSLLHKLIWKTSEICPLKLLLEQVNMIDGLNKGKVTPSFIAASKGNIDQLQHLHKMGADLSFQVDGDFLIDEAGIEDKIYRIKQVHYSGYTLLHIACQNGQINTVKYLVQQNKKMLNVTNALGMRPGLVACENGFLNIIKEMFHIDTNLFSNECLYYASKHNHVDIVKWLVSKDVKFTCISDKLSYSAYQLATQIKLKNTSKLALSDQSSLSSPHIIYPLDIWWQVFKFDPLLVGIRQGSSETVKYLIKIFPDSLKCSDAFGFTAALTIVAFNRSELLPYVVKNIAVDKCQPVSFYLRNPSFEYVKNMILNNTCPEGGGIAHMLPFHYSLYMFTYIMDKGLVKNWNQADKNEFLPIHYAAVNKNLNIIWNYKLLGNKIEKANGPDGITVYHIAAYNGLLGQINATEQTLLGPIPELKDNFGRSVLHFVVSKQFNAQYAIDDHLYDIYLRIFKTLTEYYKHDFLLCDISGKNVLHYALQNGHFKIVHYLQRYHNIAFKMMLLQKDRKGDQPITFALKMLEEFDSLSTEPFCFICLLYSHDLYDLDVILNWRYYGRFMSARELSLLQVIKQMTKWEYQELLEPYLSYILSKSVPLLIAIVKQHHQYIDQHLLGSLLKRDSDLKLSKFNQLALAYLLPSVFRYCEFNTIPSDSPLLFIVRHFDYGKSFFSLIDLLDTEAFVHIFQSHKPECTDRHGKDIIYHAVKSGNIMAARWLIRYMDSNKVTLTAIDIKILFLAALTSQRRVTETNFYDCSSKHASQASCTDLFLAKVLKMNERSLRYVDFCRNGTSSLSLIHILSANGMRKTLRLLVSIFSPQILECYNLDGFTPLYFAQIFEESIASFMPNKTYTNLPDSRAEDFFITSILHDFPLRDYSLCEKRTFGRRRIGHWHYCASDILRELSLSKQYYLKKVSSILQNIWGIFYRLVICNDYFFHYSKINSLPECGRFVNTCFRCYSDVKRLQSSFREFFVLKTVGELPSASKVAKLDRIIQSLMTRLLNVADYKFCAKYEKWIFDALHLSSLNTVTYGQRAIRGLTVSYFLRLKKADIKVQYKYSFLRSRLAVFSDTVLGIKQNVISNVQDFDYLDIIRRTLSYGDFRDALDNDVTALAVYEPRSQSVELKAISLQDPFEDLQ